MILQPLFDSINNTLAEDVYFEEDTRELFCCHWLCETGSFKCDVHYRQRWKEIQCSASSFPFIKIFKCDVWCFRCVSEGKFDRLCLIFHHNAFIVPLMWIQNESGNLVGQRTMNFFNLTFQSTSSQLQVEKHSKVKTSAL